MKKILTNNYVVSLFSKIAVTILALINSIMINRYLGPTLKGEYAVIINVISILVLVLNLGIYQTYPIFKKKELKNAKDIFVNNVFFLFIIMFLISTIVALFVKRFFLVAIVLTPLMVLSRQLNFIILVEKPNKRNIINILDTLFYTGIIVGVYAFIPVSEKAVNHIVSAMFVKEIIFVLLSMLLFKIEFNSKYIKMDILFKSIKMGFKPMIIVLLLNLNYKIDVVILKSFVDYYYIGIYSVGVLLAEQVWLITDAFKDILFSKMSKNAEHKETVFVAKLNIYGVLLVMFIILFLGKYIISFLYGNEYVDAHNITVIMLLGVSGMTIYKILYPYYLANDLRTISLIILSISTAINIILNFSLIPLLGIMGSAVSAVISYMICGIAYMIDFSKRTNTKISDFLIIKKTDFKNFKRLFSK